MSNAGTSIPFHLLNDKNLTQQIAEEVWCSVHVASPSLGCFEAGTRTLVTIKWNTAAGIASRRYRGGHQLETRD